MNMTILPKMKNGVRSSVFLLIAFISLILAGIKALTGLPFQEVLILLNVMIFVTLVLFSISMIFGIRAIRKEKERSLLVFIVILLDLFFIIILALILLGLSFGS